MRYDKEPDTSVLGLRDFLVYLEGHHEGENSKPFQRPLTA